MVQTLLIFHKMRYVWHEIKTDAKNLEMGEFAVMPNHLHDILIFYGNETIEKIKPILVAMNPLMARLTPVTRHV